jgi:hypothetical protein
MLLECGIVDENIEFAENIDCLSHCGFAETLRLRFTPKTGHSHRWKFRLGPVSPFMEIRRLFGLSKIRKYLRLPQIR